MVRPIVRPKSTATDVRKSASGGEGAPTTSSLDSKHDCDISFEKDVRVSDVINFCFEGGDSDVIDFSCEGRASDVSDLPYGKRALQWGSCLLSGKHYLLFDLKVKESQWQLTITTSGN